MVDLVEMLFRRRCSGKGQRDLVRTRHPRLQENGVSILTLATSYSRSKGVVELGAVELGFVELGNVGLGNVGLTTIAKNLWSPLVMS